MELWSPQTTVLSFTTHKSTLPACSIFIMAPSLKNRMKASRSISKPYEDPDRICGCLAYCHGERIPVSGRTYRRHMASRDQELSFSAEFMGFLAPSPRPSQPNLPNTGLAALPPTHHEGAVTVYPEADAHVGMDQLRELWVCARCFGFPCSLV
jgi:hypothetical protein